MLSDTSPLTRNPETGSGGIAKALPWLLFFPYPLALLTPAGTGVLQRFYFAFPIALTAGMLIFIFFIIGRYRSPCQRLNTQTAMTRAGALAIVLVTVSASLLMTRHRLLPMIQFSTLFSVPLWFALARRELIPRRLMPLFSVLWGIHSAHLLWETATGRLPVGLCGNRNWMVSFSLALAPWVWLSAGEWAASRRKLKANTALTLTAVLRLLILVITFTALWFGRSRAGWLLLAAYPLWSILIRFLSPSIRSGAVILLACGLLLAAVFHNPDRLTELDPDGVRLPMWRGSWNMLMDNPVLGVGAGNFRRDFPLYRRPEQTASPKAAPVTDHPHNEILHVAVSLGIPVALLGLITLLPLLTPPPPGRGWRAAHFSAFILVGHGMLDLTMARQPTALLGLICLGLLWRRRLPVRISLPNRVGTGHNLNSLRLPQWVGVAAIILLGGFLLSGEVGFQWYNRRAAVAEVKEDYAAAYHLYLQAGRFAPDQVEPFVYAGSLALFQLQQPARALELFAVARDIEPDFGHLNRNIGIALARLGDDRQALDFFTREADLFPFDHPAQSNLLTGRLATNNLTAIEETMTRVEMAIANTLRHHRSPEQTRQLATQFADAARVGDRQLAVSLAAILTAPVARGGVLPSTDRQVLALLPNYEQADHIPGPSFSSSDAVYWHWLAREPAQAEDIVYDRLTAVREVEHQRRRQQEAALLFADHLDHPLALVIDQKQSVQLAAAAGRGARNTVTLEKSAAGTIEPETWFRGLRDLGIQEDFLRLAIPVSPWDTLERNRILSIVLRRHGVKDLLPPPVPPAYRRFLWRRQLLPELAATGHVKIEHYPWAPPFN